MRADPAGHESKQVYPLSNKKASPNNPTITFSRQCIITYIIYALSGFITAIIHYAMTYAMIFIRIDNNRT